MGDEAKEKDKTVGQREAREKCAVGRGASPQGSQLLSVSLLRRSGRLVTSDVRYTWGLLQDLGICPESSLCRANQGGSSLHLEQGGGWSYFSESACRLRSQDLESALPRVCRRMHSRPPWLSQESPAHDDLSDLPDPLPSPPWNLPAGGCLHSWDGVRRWVGREGLPSGS